VSPQAHQDPALLARKIRRRTKRNIRNPAIPIILITAMERRSLVPLALQVLPAPLALQVLPAPLALQVLPAPLALQAPGVQNITGRPRRNMETKSFTRLLNRRNQIRKRARSAMRERKPEKIDERKERVERIKSKEINNILNKILCLNILSLFG
jgi:hypothetical protein